MVKLTTTSVTIGGRSYNRDKSGYPVLPTIYSGVDIQWGAGSCIEHPDPSRATLSLWVPKTHETYLPTLGEVVQVKASLQEGPVTPGIKSVTVFEGKIESVKIQDDHQSPKPVLLPNSTNITNLSGWTFSYSTGYYAQPPDGPRTNINSSVTILGKNRFMIPYQSATESFQWLWVKTPKATVVAGKTYSMHWKTNYVAGMYSYVRWYNAAGVKIGNTILVNNNAFDRFVMITAPALATKVDFEVSALHTPTGSTTPAPHEIGEFIFNAADDMETPGYRINVTAADALAEAARLRLADTPWPFENVLNRQARIADLATRSGVKFYSGLTEEQGYYESLGTSVRARDIDSYPALEAFQRTTMAAGHTVLSASNVVQPSINLKLPQVLLGDQPASGVVYGYDPSGAGKHVKKVNGVITRTNWATYASANNVVGNPFSTLAGTGGVAGLSYYSYDAKFGDRKVRGTWTTSATTGLQGISYKQSGITGASASRVSGGMWVRTDIGRTVKLAVNLFSGTTARGSGLSTTYTLAANVWTYIKFDGVTATGAYDTVEVMVQAQTNMLVNQWIDVDGVLIEKTAVGGGYFDRYTLDPAANIIASERVGIPAFDASAIVDDVFELDTSDVVNEINVEMKRFVGTAGPPGWESKDEAYQDFNQIYRDEAGSRKTTPQTRSIATDWTIRDGFMDNLLPTSVMATKGKLLLAGQSKPTWRLSSAMTLVLDEVPTQESMYSLLEELGRFGALIKITNGPSFIPQYMRARSGRIVLGENPALEFELEPVEYSAPIPLSRATLSADDVASNYRLQNFKTLTPNDLRTIGAR